MNEVANRNLNEVGEVRSIHESTTIIRENEQIMGRSAVRIGQELEYIKQNKTYKQLGYKTLKEYGEKTLGYKEAMITRLCRIGREIESSPGITNIQELSIRDLAKLALIPDKRERKAIAEKRDDYNRDEFYKLITEKKTALEEKRKAEQAKIKTEEELEKLKAELEAERNKEPKIKEKVVTETVEKEVVPERVKQQLKQVEQRKQELEERVGKLDKYNSEVNNYKRKKREAENEIEQLMDYKRELENKNNELKKRAEIVQGVRNAIEGVKKNKGKVEELFMRDIKLTENDLRSIETEAEYLQEFTNELFRYVQKKRNGQSFKEADVIDVNW